MSIYFEALFTSVANVRPCLWHTVEFVGTAAHRGGRDYGARAAADGKPTTCFLHPAGCVPFAWSDEFERAFQEWKALLTPTDLRALERRECALRKYYELHAPVAPMTCRHEFAWLHDVFTFEETAHVRAADGVAMDIARYAVLRMAARHRYRTNVAMPSQTKLRMHANTCVCTTVSARGAQETKTFGNPDPHRSFTEAEHREYIYGCIRQAVVHYAAAGTDATIVGVKIIVEWC